MKLAAVFLFYFVGMSGVFAQELKGKEKEEQELPLDDRGKYIYYEVVSQKGKTAEELIAKAKAYFKSESGPKITLKVQDSLYTGKGKLILNKTAFVLTRPFGEVRYQLFLDFKDGKYRFWLTDFSFIPYQRDRYGNFVPATTVGLPLEQKPGKLNATEWASYVKATAKEAGVFANNFKEAMLADAAIILPTPKAVPVQTTKNQKW